MSPIIYTPHNCETPEGDLQAGTLWQCGVCETIWEADRRLIGEWNKIAQPRRERIIAAALKRPAHTSEPTTPTVTPDMVQLAVDTYTDHTDTVTRGKSTYCAACNEHLMGVIEFRLHALSMAYAALQDALRGETHE